MSKLTLSEYSPWTKTLSSKNEMSKWKFGLTVKICPIVHSIWTWSFASRSY